MKHQCFAQNQQVEKNIPHIKKIAKNNSTPTILNAIPFHFKSATH